MTRQEADREIKSGWTRSLFSVLSIGGLIIGLYVANERTVVELRGSTEANKTAIGQLEARTVQSLSELKLDRQRDQDKTDSLNARLSAIEGDIKAIRQGQELLLRSMRNGSAN